MRRTRILTATAVAAATVMSVTAGSAPAAKARSVTCTFNITVQPPPTPPTGTHFGLIRCNGLGSGVHYNTFVATPTSATTGTIDVRFRNYFDTGSNRGIVKGTYTAASATDIAYTGTLRWTRTTGSLVNHSATGTVNCTSTDGGAHKACTVKLKVVKRTPR